MNDVKTEIRPETNPHPESQINFTASYKTCQADIVVGKEEFGLIKRKIFSVVSIYNTAQGNGAASFLMKRLEGLARQRRCDQIWYPIVLNPKLGAMLISRGYTPVQQTFHEERIIIFKKGLK